MPRTAKVTDAQVLDLKLKGWSDEKIAKREAIKTHDHIFNLIKLKLCQV